MSKMDLNGTLVVNETFQSTTSRSLNEIIDNGTALEDDNKLVIRRQAGPGVFDVSRHHLHLLGRRLTGVGALVTGL